MNFIDTTDSLSRICWKNDGSRRFCAKSTIRLVLVVRLYLGMWSVSQAQITQEAYVTNFFSTRVQVIDTASQTAGSSVAVGAHPEGATVTPDGAAEVVPNSSPQLLFPRWPLKLTARRSAKTD